MNPAIHHPYWYEASGLLTKAEVQQSLATAGATISVPQISRFQVGTLEVQCLPGQWQALTSDEAERERLTTIAVGTFKLLRETPITQYGMNSHFAVGVGTENVGALLTAHLGAMAMAAPFDGIPATYASLAVSYGLAPLELGGQPPVHRKLNVTIRPSAEDGRSLRVDVNRDHTIGPAQGHFDLDVMLEHSADAFEQADNYLVQILARLRPH